jgi:hypothetical protein
VVCLSCSGLDVSKIHVCRKSDDALPTDQTIETGMKVAEYSLDSVGINLSSLSLSQTLAPIYTPYSEAQSIHAPL